MGRAMGEDEETISGSPASPASAAAPANDARLSSPSASSAALQQQQQQNHVIPEFWSEVSSLTNTLLESDLNTKNATHCLSNYVLETLVLPAIHPEVISITRKREFMVALNVCEVSVATVLSKPHVLKTLMKDDPESVMFLMESANQFAMKAIEVICKENGSSSNSVSVLRRSSSLSATSHTSGGGSFDQEDEMATQSDGVDFGALRRAANLLRATLDGCDYAQTWATEVIRDSKVRVAEEKASFVSASTEIGEDDVAMTMSTTSSTAAANEPATREQHQRPREPRDSNRALKEKEAIAKAQRESEIALDKIREEATAAANKAAERKRYEQSDVAKEKRDAKRDSDNREKVLGSFIGLNKTTVSKNDATNVATEKVEKRRTPSSSSSSSLKTNSNESYRERALARVLLVSSKNESDNDDDIEDNDGDDTLAVNPSHSPSSSLPHNHKLDLCTNVLLNAIDSILKGGVTQEEFPALVALGDAFESFVTKCTGAMSSHVSDIQFLSLFDNALNTLSRAHSDISRSDSVRARLAKSVALLAPNRETMTNTRLNVILTIFDETMRRHEELHDDDVAMSPDVSAIVDMARSIIGAPTDVSPFELTFESTTTDVNSIDGDLPMSLRKCIIDRAIFGSQKVSKRLFRIACGWLARIISEATVTTSEETSEDKQERLAAEQALEGIFKSSEFVFGLSVHYGPTRNDTDADRAEISSSPEDDEDDDEYDLEDFFEAANAKIIFGLLAWHALPVHKRRASALEICFVRNDYYERRGRNKMKSLKSIVAAHRVASTLAHLVRFFDNPPDFVLESFKNLAIGAEKLVSVKDEFLWFSWKSQIGDVERVEAYQASRTKSKFASDLANLGAHQMCAILADEDNLAQNSNFDQQVANKLKRALGRLTFLLPYDATRIYKSQIGGSFVERKTTLGSLESIDEDEVVGNETSPQSSSSQEQQQSMGSDMSRSRGGMTLLHHTRDLVVSSSSASALVAVMNSTEDPSNKIDVLKIFALGSSLLQGTSIDLNKNKNARNPLVLAGFDEALVALTRSVETNVVVPNVVVWTDLARACETLIARREDAINEYHNAQHESASPSSSGMVENFCDMVAYAKLPKSAADHAFETYFPNDIFDRYNDDAFFASISEESWEKFKTETARNVGARGKKCGLNVNVERYFLDEIADMNSMALLLERICATTVALCKKQSEIDAHLKEGVADTSSPMKSTAAASLKRSLSPEMVAARSKLSEVMEKLSRAPMLNGLSKIALTAADAARPTSVTELEKIDIQVSRAFHEALPETLAIALRNIAIDATSSAEKHPLKEERMPESIVSAVIDRVKRATSIIAEKSQNTDTRLAARAHPNVAIFMRAICDIFASFSTETKQYYSAEVMSSICDSIATIAKVMPVEIRKTLATIDELKTVESITMLLDNVKVKKSARSLVDALEISLDSEDDVVSRALRSMPGIIEKGRFDAAAYILKRYLSEDSAVNAPESTSPSPSKDAVAEKDTRYVEYAAEAVIDSLRSFYLEDDEDNDFKSGAESGIFSTVFKQRGVTDKTRETCALESFAKLLRLVVKAGKDASRVMSNEASLRRFITSTPRDRRGGVESDTGTSEPNESANHTPASEDAAEDMEYETIEEQIARDSEIEHELFEQELIALSNVPIIEQLLRQANLDDSEGGEIPLETSGRRELTLEAAFSSLLSEARVAFGNNRRSSGGDLQQRGSTNAQTTSSPQGRVVDVLSTGDAKDGETTSNSAAKCSYISQRDYQRQHWYYCYDCNLVGNRGCCSTCAVTCHKGHRLAYSRESKFSCDCGAGQSKRDGALRPCGCITANQAKLTKDEWKAEVVGKPSELIHSDSDSELEDESVATLDTSSIEKKLIATWTLPRELSAKLGSALKSARVSDVLERVANNCVDKLGDNESDDDSSEDEDYVRASSASKSAQDPNKLSRKRKEKFMNFSRAMKPGTFDVKPREDFAAQTQAISQVLPLPRKSCVSTSTSGLLAIGEGDKISILSAEELYHSTQLADKCNALLRAKATFEVFNVCFNPSDASKLAVTGLRDAHIFAISETAEVTNRIAIENLFDEDQEFGALLSAQWVPGCARTLALCSRDYAKLYDCGGKNSLVTPDAPTTSITPPIGRNFVDCAFFIETDGADEKLIFVGLLDNGELHCFSLEGDTTFISLYENTLISTDSFPELTRRNAKFGEPDSPTLSFSPRGKNGVSLHYSQTHDLLIVSYESGDTVVAALERDRDYPDSFKLRAPKVIRDEDYSDEMMMSPLSSISTAGTGSLFDSQPSSAQYSQPSSAQSYATCSSKQLSKHGKGDSSKGLAYVGDCAFQRDFRARSIGADPEVPPLSFIAVSRRDMSTRVLTFQNESNFEGVDTQTLLNKNIVDSAPESTTLRGFAGYQPDWDKNHANSRRKMLCLLLEDGSLRVYFYGEDREIEHRRGEEEAVVDDDEEEYDDVEDKEYHLDSHSSPSMHDSGDVLYFEGCSEITEKCSIYGEFYSIGDNDEDLVSSVKETLISEDLNSQIQSARANAAAALCLSYPPAARDPQLQSFAGIRVHLNYGSSAEDANCVPKSVEIFKGGRKVSLVDIERTRSNSTGRNTNSQDAASEVMGDTNTRWFDIPLNSKEAKLCSEKNGLLTLVFHPSTNAPRGACFKIARVLAYSSPKAHIEESMKTRAIAAREQSLLHVRSRVARATRHIENTSSAEEPSSLSGEKKQFTVGFPSVLYETFAAITVYARLEQAAASSASTTPVKAPTRLSFSKLQNQSAAVRVFAADGWSPSPKTKRIAFKAILAKNPEDVTTKDFCTVSVALSIFRMIQKNYEWRRDANWALPESDIESFGRACRYIGRPFVRRPLTMQTCDEQFQKQTLEALRLGLSLTPRVVRDSHGAFDCEEFVPSLIRALIASCEGFANNPPSAKLAQKAASIAVACLKSSDENFSRSVALAMLDSFAPRVPNVDFFFDHEVSNDGGNHDSLRHPVFPVSLRDGDDATINSSNGNTSRLRRPTLISAGSSSGFATSENTPSGMGILSSLLTGNIARGGHRCDMCDESIEGIRWHCEVCDDVDLCSECRDRGGITGALLEQGHRTTHPLTRIVQRRNPPPSNDVNAALLNKKKTFVALTESNKKLIGAIVEDICDPTRTSATKGLMALLSSDDSEGGLSARFGKDSKPPKPSVTEGNIASPAHAMFLRTLLKSDSEASVLVAKLLSKGIVVPSILSKPGTMGKNKNISDRDCRILALSASAAMASSGKDTALAYSDGKNGARDVLEWTKRVVESLLGKIADLGRSDSLDKCDNSNNKMNISLDVQSADYLNAEKKKIKLRAEQRDKLIAALKCALLQAKYARDALNKSESESASFETESDHALGVNVSDISNSTADIQNWTKLIVQSYATSESLRLDIVDSDTRSVTRFTEFELVVDSLSRSVDVQNEKFQAIKDAGIIVSACERLVSSLKNNVKNENSTTRSISSPLEALFVVLSRTPEAFAFSLASMPSVIVAAVKSTAKAMPRFPLSAVDQREHACLIFEFAAEYCAESTKKELSGVVDCIIQTTLLGSSKKSARDSSMTCLRAMWKNFKDVRVENERQNIYLAGMARSLTKALSNVAYGARIERVSQIVAFALEKDFSIFANEPDVMANLELFCENARKASEKLRTHPRREMYAKLEALEAQSQSVVTKSTPTAAMDNADTLPQPIGAAPYETAVNALIENDEDFAKHAKWLETDPNPDDISLAYASTPYRKTPLHLMKGTRAFTASASLTIFSEAYRVKEVAINLTPLQTRRSSRWPKSVSIWVVPSVVSASSSILNSNGSGFLSNRQIPRATGSNGADNNIISSLKSGILWEQPSEPWEFVGNITFKNRQNEGLLNLSIPEDISAIAIRIDSFHIDVHEKASEMLPCPRCSRHVQDTAHGICRYCRENAYQCRQCRNINYENLTDAFWCNECGCARQDKLDAYITHSEVIGDGSSGIYTEDEATSAMKALEILTVKEHDTQNILRQCESTCRSLLSRAAVVDESEILNAEVNKTASAPSTPSRTRKTIGGGNSNAVPVPSALVSGYVPVGRNHTLDSAFAKNGDFEALALQSYKEVAKSARITLAKCQAKRISLHRALENYARRGEGGFTNSSLHTSHNYYGEETNHFGSLRSYMFAIVPAMVSLAREKVFFYAFDSNNVKDALFATSSILPQMAPKFSRVLVALAVADANVDTRSWLIKQTSERAKTSSLRPEGGGINFTSSTFETDVDVLSRLARMELVKRNDANGDATIAILQLSETLNPTKNPNHRFVDVAVRAALKLFEQDAIARPGGRRRMDNDNIDAISGCIECFVNSRVLEEETVRLASSALVAISKGTKDERLAVLKALLELLKNTDVVSYDDAAESVYTALEASMHTDWEVQADSFVFTFIDPSQVKLPVRTLTEMLLEVAKYAWRESESLLEQHGLVDPSFGLALKRCAKFVSEKIVSDEDDLRYESLKLSEEDVQAIAYAATIARALAAYRAPHAISANIILAKLLDACYGASDVNYPNTSRVSVAGACFELLRSTANANSRIARFSELSHAASDAVHVVLPMGSVLDELKRCALPKPKPKRTCLVRLVKSSTQEEFIRGHMSPSPYDVAEQIPVGDNEGDNNTTSSDAANAGGGVDADDDGTFGDDTHFESTPTFRDVKNFICAQLDLAGLIEDDFGMELLSCGNKIISLDLKVVDVYEKVWVPMQQNDGSPPSGISGTNRIPPMSITYRLSGLDGEATEDRIDSVAATVDKDDPEVRFKMTSCLRFKGGLSALVALVPTISRAARMKPTASEAINNNINNNNTSVFLKELCVSREDVAFVRKLNDNTDVLALLQAACELKENRIAMLEDNALPHLLREAARAFEAREDTLANDILKVVDRLLAEEQSKTTTEQSSILLSNDSSSQQTMLMRGGSVDDSASLDLSVTVDTSLAARPATPPPRTSTPSIIDLASSAALGGSGIDLYFSDAESMHEEDKSLFDAASVSKSFLDKLKRCIQDGEPKRCDVLARVLPRLACADVTATTHLVKFCVDALNTLKFDGQQCDTDDEVLGSQIDLSCDLLALESVVKIVRCAPHDDFGRSFREYLAVPAIPIIRSYIVDIVVNDLKRTSEAFEKAMVNYKGLPLALKILEAMSRECEKVATSAAHALNLLVTLHTLENVIVPKGLGTLAENALETIENASNTAQIEIEKMREKTKEEKRELAKRKREQMLREMKMKTQLPDNASLAGDEEGTVLRAEVSDSLKSQMEEDAVLDDDNEGALRCRVCFESINENPEETMGLYCFCTPISIPPTSVKFTREEDATNAANVVIEEDDDDEDDEGIVHDDDGDVIEIIDMRGNQSRTGGSSLASALFGGRGFRGRSRAAASVDPKVDATRGSSTVSHFNAIHISCHLTAKRADINRRPPKREWEGATLRNAETLCNNVLPVWTSSDLRSSNVERTSTSDEEYEERRRRYGLAVDAWWDNVGRAMPMNRQSFAMRHDRFRVSTFDCVVMLGRFATNSSFSIESRGGGRESNASVLPQLLRLMQFHGEYVFDASANPSTITDPSASPLRRQSSSPVPLSVGKKRDIAQREEWLRLANALVDEDYGGDELAFFDACFDIEAFENDMYAILLFAAMTFTKERWESSIKIFIRRATAFALRCGDDGLRGAFTSSAYAQQQQQRSTSTISSNSGGVMSPPETDTDEPHSMNASSQPMILAAKPTLKYLAICDEINAWLRKDSPEVFYTPGLSVSLQHLSRALLDEPDPSIRDHIRRSEALALDQQSRDQFGNMESCAQLSKRTLEVVSAMDACDEITNLSKIGGRNITVTDIIEKGIA